MELRHLRHFVAVADERSFLAAARRLNVSQPALSKQVRDLEEELGVQLFIRTARGVVLTPAGQALVVEARATLASAERAIVAVRQAQASPTMLRFVHGELVAYSGGVAGLLSAYRGEASKHSVEVSQLENELALMSAVREGRADVAALFTTVWPIEGFEGHRLLSCPATGVVLAAKHPLAANPVVRLSDLKDLTFIQVAGANWPQVYHSIDRALRSRGLVPAKLGGGSTSAAQVEIAAGDAWALANETAAQVFVGSPEIVYRPFAEPPIPSWLALIWLPGANGTVTRLVEVAKSRGLVVSDEVRE